MEINRLVRYLAFVLEIYFLYLLQQTPGLFPEIYGARPVLLFPVAVSIAMLETELPAMSFGIVAGLFVDFGFGGALGFHSLTMAVICYFVSVLSRTVLRVNMGAAMLMGMWTIAVFVILGWLYQYVWNGYSYISYALLHHYLPKYMYTLLLFPLIFMLTRGLARAMRSPE